MAAPDESYFLDMVIAARKIKEFTQGMTEDDFHKSELHQNAVARLFQVIGEAARRVSESAKSAHPEIEWYKIAGMRNQLIHQYSRINWQTVWETIVNDLDTLISQLDPLIPPDDEQE